MSFLYDSGLWLATRKIWVRFGRWMCSSMVRVGHHVPLGIWSLICRLPSCCGFTASLAAPPAPPHLLLQFLCVPSQVCVQQSSKKHQHFLQITVSSSLEMVRDRYGFQFVLLSGFTSFDCVDHNQLWKILQEMGIPDHLTCLLRNLYAGQETTVRTGDGTTDWFQIGKGVR